MLALGHRFLAIAGFICYFSITPYQRKPLMFFDGCDGALGCSVCLRGGTYEQLTKVLKCLSVYLSSFFSYRVFLTNLGKKKQKTTRRTRTVVAGGRNLTIRDTEYGWSVNQ